MRFWDSKSRSTTRRLSSSLLTSTSRHQRLYLIAVCLQGLIVVTMLVSSFGLIQANVPRQTAELRTVAVYLATFFLAEVFSVLVILDAINAQNIITVGLHLLFDLCLFIYSIFQITQTKRALQGQASQAIECSQGGEYWSCVGPGGLFNVVEPLLIVIPVAIGIFGILAEALLVRGLYYEFGWEIFKLTSASLELKSLHRSYQVTVSLLKFLSFFAFSFALQFLILASWNRNINGQAEWIITIIMVPLSLGAVFLCGWSIRAENRVVMAACLVAMLAGLAYFLYKDIVIFLPAQAALYDNIRTTLAVFSISSTVLLAVTFGFGVQCYLNFGRGLKDVHYNPANKTSVFSYMPSTRRPQSDIEKTRPLPTIIDLDGPPSEAATAELRRPQ